VPNWLATCGKTVARLLIWKIVVQDSDEWVLRTPLDTLAPIRKRTDKRVNAVIGKGSSATSLKKHLLAEKLMAKPKQGFVVQRRIFRGGKGNKNFAWVCAFSPAIVA
jgi:hypothetical protein